MLVFSIRKHWLSHLWEIIRSLANNDGDVNENGKKVIGLDWQNNKSAHASCFFVNFFAVTTRLQHKMPNFTFYGECEHNTTTLFFLLNSIQSYLVIIQRNRTISVIKFEAAQRHFLSDIFVAIAVVVA